jgi:hypothetical protein
MNTENLWNPISTIPYGKLVLISDGSNVLPACNTGSGLTFCGNPPGKMYFQYLKDSEFNLWRELPSPPTQNPEENH